MEGRPQPSATARTRPPSVSSGRSVLHSLQSENESLRSELLRCQQANLTLRAQLSDLRSNTDKIVQDAVAANKEHTHALEERCRLLADRLVAAKRDEQVSESSRVGFLLRSQMEERRFLQRGVKAMLEMLVDGDAPALQAANADPEAHTGTLYRLVMATSDALLEHTAAAKLEKARTRLTLEHAAAALEELHGALRDAARAAFDAAAQASAMEEEAEEAAAAALAVAGDGGEAAPQSQSLVMVSRGALFSSLRRGYATPSPSRRSHMAGSRGEATHNTSAASWRTAAPSSVQLSDELEWVCDVLKACMRGLREVGTDIAAANAGLQAPPSLPDDTRLPSRIQSSLAETASPEMNELLRSFLGDLATIKRRAAQQQEEMARQLASEVDRHHHSAQQYEERIRLLERECAQLLRYAERVAEEQAKHAAAAADAAVSSAPAKQGFVAAATTAAAAPPLSKSSAMTSNEGKENVGEAEVEVTPERYVAKRREDDVPTAASSTTSQRDSALPKLSAMDSNTRHQSQQPRSLSTRERPPRERKRGGSRQSSKPAASQLAGVETPERFNSTRPSPRHRLDYSTAGPLLLSPRRHSWVIDNTPVIRTTTTYAAAAAPSPSAAAGEASTTAPSAAAAALWSRYRHRTPASTTAPQLSSPPRDRLLSPAPPATSHPFASSASAAARRSGGVTATPMSPARSTSPWRRSMTAPSPSAGGTAAATLRPAPRTASLSSVSSTSDRFSTPRPTATPTDRLIASSSPNTRVRGALPLVSPMADRGDAPGATAATSRVKTLTTPTATTAITTAAAAAASMAPLSPPRNLSVLSSRSTHSRLSQQLYDEAAADVFTSDSTSFHDDVATPKSAVLHHGGPSASAAGVEGSPEVRQPSPRRPIHFGFLAPHDSARGGQNFGAQSTPPSPAPLPSPPRNVTSGGGVRAMRVSPHNEEADVHSSATPPIWRRIKEETSLYQPHMLSPIAAASDLFNTPREVSWIDS